MDRKDKICMHTWGNDSRNTTSLDPPPYSGFNSHLEQHSWGDPSNLDYGIRIEPSVQKLGQSSMSQASPPCNSNSEKKNTDQEDVRMHETLDTCKIQDWDTRTMLSNLSFLEQKIHELQDLVHSIVGQRGQVLGRPDELAAQQEQLITADLTSIIAQLISTAGSLLPSLKHTFSKATLSSFAGQFGQLDGSFNASGVATDACFKSQSNIGSKLLEQPTQTDLINNYGTDVINIEEHESKYEEDADESEHLTPGTYEILQLEKEEILAPHTHFCAICGKGFKRDANLRMHMRGHGDEYKTPAALAKPNKESSSEPTLVKRYSCPYAGCKRNKDHKKFQPLKTILCVKNHYKRTHCDKSYTCSRCNTKKFSVIADLKTHEKHCGKDKWLCSCGTTFSRKDKLFGHIALFQGHTPVIPVDETNGIVGLAEHRQRSDGASRAGSINFNFGSTAPGGGGLVKSIMDVKESVEDPTSYFSPLNFDSCNFDGFHEFPRPPFEDSESSFSFLMPGSCNYTHKTGGELNSNKHG